MKIKFKSGTKKALVVIPQGFRRLEPGEILRDGDLFNGNWPNRRSGQWFETCNIGSLSYDRLHKDDFLVYIRRV